MTTTPEQRQAAALAEGRKAEAEGRPVIYIHGRPYADPGHDASAQQEPQADTSGRTAYAPPSKDGGTFCPRPQEAEDRPARPHTAPPAAATAAPGSTATTGPERTARHPSRAFRATPAALD